MTYTWYTGATTLTPVPTPPVTARGREPVTSSVDVALSVSEDDFVVSGSARPRSPPTHLSRRPRPARDPTGPSSLVRLGGILWVVGRQEGRRPRGRATGGRVVARGTTSGPETPAESRTPKALLPSARGVGRKGPEPWGLEGLLSERIRSRTGVPSATALRWGRAEPPLPRGSDQTRQVDPYSQCR